MRRHRGGFADGGGRKACRYGLSNTVLFWLFLNWTYLLHRILHARKIDFWRVVN